MLVFETIPELLGLDDLTRARKRRAFVSNVLSAAREIDFSKEKDRQEKEAEGLFFTAINILDTKNSDTALLRPDLEDPKLAGLVKSCLCIYLSRVSTDVFAGRLLDHKDTPAQIAVDVRSSFGFEDPTNAPRLSRLVQKVEFAAADVLCLAMYKRARAQILNPLDHET